MLLDNEVKVKSKYNYDLYYYKSLGYDVDDEYFSIKIEHLPKKSFNLVKVSCDYCGVIENISFYKFNRSLQSPVKKYCCKACKGEKLKESNLLKYGVTSVAKLATSKEKSKKTNLENWGVDNAMKSAEVKLKLKDSIKEKWGVENPMQNEIVKLKQKGTIISKWKVDNISKVEEIKNKKKETTMRNWGVDVPIQSDLIKEKIKLTNFKNHEKEYFTQSNDWRKLNYQIAQDSNYLEYLKDSISLFKCDLGMEHDFEITKDVYSKRKIYNVSLCTICNPVGDNRSIKENDLFNFISTIFDGVIIQTYRDGKMEIDIFIPQLKIGFEFNGLYWHSDIFKDKNFHKNKSEFFSERGIRLIHIWEDDWDNKRSIIESQISNLLLKSRRKIAARNCEVRIIDSVKTCREFIDENHIQGYANSYLKLGLFLGEELVSIMTFDHNEGRNKMSSDEWNLNRFCTKIGLNVVGGASKLFIWFLKNIKPKKVVSYADLDWSRGDIYYKLGFSLEYQTSTDYKYIINNKRMHKSKLRKSFTGISESKLDIPKIWDCGKMKFIYIKTNH